MSNRDGKNAKPNKTKRWRKGSLCRVCGKGKIEAAKCHRSCLICKTCGTTNF